jgi:nitrogen-specific signal transduction histidine kinase
MILHATEAAIAGALLQEVPAGVVVVDGAGRVRYANRSAAEIMGRTRQECLGLGLERLFGAEAAAEILRERAGPGERRLTTRLPMRGEDAPPAGLSIVTPGQGQLADVVGERPVAVIFREIEEQRLVEEDLRRLEGQAALGRIVAGLAHELRNPLAAIQGLSFVMMDECAETDPAFEPARRIAELVERMTRLVAACVAVGNPAPPRTESCPVGGLVEQAIESLSPRWGRNGRAPVVTSDHGGLSVEADPSQAVQCLRALVDNALDAAGDPARVAVRIRRSERRLARGQYAVRVEVRDDGPGIPGALLSRVFEPFFTTKPDRNGLGLAVAQAFALRNRGSLEVRSAPGETVFALSLPVVAGRR